MGNRVIGVDLGGRGEAGIESMLLSVIEFWFFYV